MTAFAGVGGLNFFTKKVKSLIFFLHVGSSLHCNNKFIISSTEIYGEITSKVIEKV